MKTCREFLSFIKQILTNNTALLLVLLAYALSFVFVMIFCFGVVMMF